MKRSFAVTVKKRYLESQLMVNSTYLKNSHATTPNQLPRNPIELILANFDKDKSMDEEDM